MMRKKRSYSTELLEEISDNYTTLTIGQMTGTAEVTSLLALPQSTFLSLKWPTSHAAIHTYSLRVELKGSRISHF